MPIPVTCACGKRFAAKDELAGKRLKCPACGGAIAIPQPPAATKAPAPQPAPAQAVDPLFANDPFASTSGEGGGFDLGNLAQFESASAAPLGAGQASPLGGSGGPMPNSLGGARGPMMSSGYGAAPYQQH